LKIEFELSLFCRAKKKLGNFPTSANKNKTNNLTYQFWVFSNLLSGNMKKNRDILPNRAN
jgi:hypothetical protein